MKFAYNAGSTAPRASRRWAKCAMPRPKISSPGLIARCAVRVARALDRLDRVDAASADGSSGSAPRMPPAATAGVPGRRARAGLHDGRHGGEAGLGAVRDLLLGRRDVR